MFFPSIIALCIVDNHAILAVVHSNSSLLTNNQQWTDILYILGLWETPATCSYMPQNPSWVYWTCWQLIILFWHEANYIILRTSHFFSLSSSSPIPLQQIMNTQPPQPGRSGSKSSRLAGASSNSSLLGTQQERRHQLVDHNVAHAATKNTTQDAHLDVVRKTGSSTKKKQHAVGCDSIHTVVNGHQLTVCHTAGLWRELRDQFISAHNGKPPWSPKAFLHTIWEIQHHDVVSSGIYADEFPEKHPWEWTKHALITVEEAMEAYMVEVLAASHFLKQQLISCQYSTCLIWWQGREVMYSWNSPTCAWLWTLPKWPKDGFCVVQ